MSALEVKSLSFSYGGTDVLSDVSFSVAAGELVGLVGPNGAGKSTLLRTALGILRPQKGEVLVDGTPVASLSRREAALRIAFVPQREPIAFGFTARQVVEMGRTPHLGRFSPAGAADLRAVDEAMRAAELQALAARPVAELSGGEQQRVLVARSFAQGCPVLLLDEPVANLDLSHQFTVLSQVRARTRAGAAAIAALHDLNLAARFCDRILVLSEGRLAAAGKPAEVLTGDVLARVFGVEARVEPGADQVWVRVERVAQGEAGR